jgi:bifunctional DNA-binding transcriptional regulator/antitoxin component of YhaV-PrlF toxin-antitoxin module
MRMMIKMKIQQNKKQFVVTIPADVMRLLKWNKGTEIVFIPKENGVEVKKLDELKESQNNAVEVEG